MRMRFPVNRHRVWQLVFDAALIVAAWRLTFFLRFDKATPIFYRHLLDWQVVALVVGLKLATFVLFGFYNRWWRYVSTRDMWGAARGVTVASALTYLILMAFPPNHTSRLPRGIAALDFLLLLAFVAGTRLLARTLIERPRAGRVAHGKEVLIVGAGDAGQLMVREMQRNRQLHYTPIGFIDDDPRKRGDRIHGVRVLGTTDDVVHVLRDNKPDEVLIAIPSAPGSVRQRIVEACRAEKVPVKTLPGLHELISGDLNLGRQIRPVQVEDVEFPAAIPVLANSGDRAKMRQVFERYRPQVLFHAAAYKHVGMLEANPLQAVSNNVLGTRALAEVAVEFGVERFVLVSTDKAADPKNVMGQSKAVCEWIVESFALHPEVETRFVAVRFGNVLGSSGSVIPIFRKQIERGGPVRVTTPEMTRFFMTIPEAASLVVQAGAMGGRGQVYVLDMGEPVRILDLAKQMIRLSGRNEEDVPIVFTGSRAGEKVHEVLWNEGEAVGPTSHPKIMRAARPQSDASWLEDSLAELDRLVEEGDTLAVVARLRSMVAEPVRTGREAMLEDTLH